MKTITILFTLIMLLTFSSSAYAQENTVEFSILPGELSVELTLEDDLVVLTVDDATGTSLGWWVRVECDCGLVVANEIETIAGQRPDREGGPRLFGRTLLAEPHFGTGSYRLTFEASPGLWTLSYGQGEMAGI